MTLDEIYRLRVTNAELNRELTDRYAEVDRLRALLNEVVSDEPFSGMCDDCFWCIGPHTLGRAPGRYHHEPQCFITRATAVLSGIVWCETSGAS